jgi:hypothetical protein
MIPLVIIIVGCSILVSVEGLLVRLALAIVEMTLQPIRSRPARIGICCVLLGVSGGVGYPLAKFILPRLPDFRSRGDGGSGLGWNTVALIATYLLAPTLMCLLFAGLLNVACRKWQANEHPPTD